MKGGYGNIFIGLVFIFIGFNCLVFKCYAYGTFLVPRFSGIVFMICGFAVVVLSLKNIIKKKYKKDQYLICPKCQNVVESVKVVEDKCLKCGADLEALTGFYERHPECKTAIKNNKIAY